MVKKRWIARNLALALLGGVWTPQSALARSEEVLGSAEPKLRRALINSIFRKFPAAHLASANSLTRFLVGSSRFGELLEIIGFTGESQPRTFVSPRFAPAPDFAHLRIPAIATLGDLAAWLGITPAHLDWYADERRQNASASSGNLHHYSYRFVPKASGALRLIEEPKPRLKAMQRRILDEILNPAPVHEKVHGFVRKRSIGTAAQIHAGEHVVMTVDLKDFFLTISMDVVHHVFRRLGYPWSVARALTGLCSGRVTLSVFDQLPAERRPEFRTRRQFAAAHLPQGSPTSPALANLAAHRLDARLQGLAENYGANYSRYADDLTFSGDQAFDRGRAGFLDGIATIVEDEGFSLNAAKTRIARASERQQVLGLVVNNGINIARPTFDALKATLHNCKTRGWRTQNLTAVTDFRAHLDGRISWVESVNPARGRKLRDAFHEIDWA
ncbi:MAG: reverse transcriptase family protein [Hyphomicrobium sp.]